MFIQYLGLWQETKKKKSETQYVFPEFNMPLI